MLPISLTSSKLIDDNNYVTPELEEYIDRYNFYIQNEYDILFSFFEDNKIKKTTGENEIYKEKLKDRREAKKNEKQETKKQRKKGNHRQMLIITQ